ncbi:nicotinate (nicotinamide) nucleotide adenylyltransferase [Kordiimonas sp.]|uniref:nicotinate (nicotinamide) nucleotide adenylyltransferase n=1 Tax=Kordiimonas sp. TaxID=1970157 RepID=UPI003A9476AB
MTSRPSYTLLPEAARWRGRTVALYGGSFNPAHKGHRRVARECLKRLEVDAIWFMISPGNPQKADDTMAAFNRRCESVSMMVGHHPRMIVTDVEKRLGTRYSADTITALQRAMPKTRFIWVMGADNLAAFHSWHRWKDIATSLPIAVFDRPGYAVRGLNSRFAKCFAQFRKTPQELKASRSPAWAFVTMPRHPASATQARQLLGKKWLSGFDRKEN